MKSVLIILSVILAINSVSGGTRCPSRLSILPCSCTRNWPYTEVTCYSSSPHQTMLLKALSELSKRKMVLDKLLIIGNIREIPDGFLHNLTVHYLIIRTINLVSISDNAFQGLTGINSVWFYDTNLTAIPVRPLSRLRLTELNVYKNNLDVLEKQLFGQMVYGPTLRTLHLKSNGIKSIGSGAFYNLIALEELSLRGNLLMKIPANALPIDSRFLTSLNLQENKFEEVPVDLIKRIPEGAKVDLSVNNIITSNFYNLLQTKKSYNLLANDLVCNCSLMVVAIFNEDNSGNLKIKGHCHEPEAIVGKSLQDLLPMDFPMC